MFTKIWDDYWRLGECAYPFFLGLIFHKKNFTAGLPKPEGQSGQVCVRLLGQVGLVVVFVALMDVAHLVTFDIEGQPGDLH